MKRPFQTPNRRFNLEGGSRTNSLRPMPTDIKEPQRFSQTLLSKKSVQEVIPMARTGVSRIRNFNDLEKFKSLRILPSQLDVAAFHPLGTARMASSPLLGVIGPDYRVFGTENLRICDGSMIPSSLGVNPQLTIMALSLRLGSTHREWVR